MGETLETHGGHGTKVDLTDSPVAGFSQVKNSSGQSIIIIYICAS